MSADRRGRQNPAAEAEAEAEKAKAGPAAHRAGLDKLERLVAALEARLAESA